MNSYNTPLLVSISDIIPASYNPRITDPKRLEYLELSLKYLGFVLPIYVVEETMTILSGHQRVLAARNLGAKLVPVVFVEMADSNKEMNSNILFNRVTNDMVKSDTSEGLLGRLVDNDQRITSLIKDMKPKELDSPEFFPCIHAAKMIPINEYRLDVNSGVFNRDGASAARMMHPLGIFMPVVMNTKGKIVNGLYRLFAAKETTNTQSPITEYQAIIVSEGEGELVSIFTNMISMSFNMQSDYADRLRFCAYRRHENRVDNLTRTVRFWADGKVQRTAIDSLKNPTKFWNKFRAIHGNHLLDFGAGQRRNEVILKKKGFNVVSFEPLPVPTELDVGFEMEDNSIPCPRLAHKVATNFLDHLLSATTKFDSIFLSSVLNSVPFYKDRLLLLAVVHALCGYTSVLYGSVRGMAEVKLIGSAVGRSSVKYSNKGDCLSATLIDQAKSFPLNYESNVVVGDILDNPKVQKFHNAEELRSLLETFFTDVRIHGSENNALYFFSATNPKRINENILRKAVEFEFNMPLNKDGTERLGMADAFFTAIMEYRKNT